MHNRMTVQGATFNMCGQLYHGHAVVSALGSKLDDLGWLGQGVVPLSRAGE